METLSSALALLVLFEVVTGLFRGLISMAFD